jgi:Fe2+ transport system protein FeoA
MKRRNMMTLDNIKPGQGGVITAIGGQGALRRRLLDMGLTPNTRVQVRKVAPMGDPIELSLRSYVLTIRKEEASKIELKEVFSI